MQQAQEDYKKGSNTIMKKGSAMILGLLTGTVAGGLAAGWLNNKFTEDGIEKIDKFKGYYNVLNQWLHIKQEGKSLEDYFTNNNYHTIAIYGMGEMGKRLYDELKNSNVQIRYAIDKKGACSELNVCTLEDELEPVDVIVVTATFAYSEIEKELKEKVDYLVVSLEDIVYEV